MIIKKLILVALMGAITNVAMAADNLYAKNYKAQNENGLVSQQAVPDTKMYVSNHKDDDNISMLESGYDMMGSSGFEAAKIAPELALQHAKSIKADTVLVYTKYANAKTADSKMDVIREAAKKGKEVTEEDLKTEENYDYYASYWAKLPTPLLGIHVIKLVRAADPDDENTKKEEVAGLKILAVIKDSPAYKAGLKKLDTIKKIGDVTINKSDDLFAAVKQYQGKTVDIAYERGDEPAIAKATLNSR